MTLADLKPYPMMKDPGIEWLGGVPDHWELQRLKALMSNVVEPMKETDGTDRYVALENVDSWTGRLTASELSTSVDSQVNLFESGDVLFGKLRPYLAKVTRPTRRGVCVGEFLVLRPRSNRVVASYVEQWLRSKPTIDAISSSTFGAKMPRTNWQSVGSMVIAVPSVAEQAGIVRFLRHADRLIQRHIRAKQKLIALLEEHKRAVIHQAVTGQIDVRTGRPYSVYMNSGVQRLERIPESWRVVRLKFVAERIVDCLHETPEYSETGEFPAIRTADISPGMVRLESARRIDEQEYLRWTERLKPVPNDILYSREGERFGIAACVPEGARVCISQRMMVFRIRSEYSAVFVMWALNSGHVYAQARQDLMGSTAPHVNVSTIRNYVFAIPSRNQQDAVVEHIGSLVKSLDGAIANARDSITRVREYQSRMVSDVVTGRLDVREWRLGM